MVDQVEVQPHGGTLPLTSHLRAWLEGRLRAKTIFLGSLAAVVVLWVGVAATIVQQHAGAVQEDRRSAHSAAVAAVEGTATVFSGTDAILVGASLRAGDSRTPDWRQLLGEAQKSLPSGVVFLAAYKTNGRLIHRTNAPAGHRDSIATLDHFRTPIESGAAGLYVGNPYKDPVTGGMVVPLVRLHPAPGRALRAILVAGIAVETLGRQLSGRDGAMALARKDGTLLAVSAPWSDEKARSDGTLPALQNGTVAEAANGMPLIATATAVDGRAQAAAGRTAVQLAAAAALASLGLIVLGLCAPRLRSAATAPATADRGPDDATHAKSVFLATMSHEFRTPLNAVIGFAEVIRDQGAVLPSEKVGEYAQDIAASGQRLLQMVNDVLDLSHIESGSYEIRPQPLDLEEIVHSVNRIVTPLAQERQVTLAPPAIAQELTLTADRRATMQILYNLVHNAAKFAEPGGMVTVTAVMETDGTVRLDVIDDGVGIPEADLARVVRPFEQSREVLTSTSTGTGLGLALVGKLVGLHGGRFTIASTEGEGTIVTIRLPAQGPSTSL